MFQVKCINGFVSMCVCVYPHFISQGSTREIELLQNVME